MREWFQLLWPYVTAFVVLAVDLWAIGHAVLYKRDPRSAVGWIGIIVVFPFFGALLYLLLGINRIQRRASSLRTRPPTLAGVRAVDDQDALLVQAALPARAHHLVTLARIVRQVAGRPLMPGNALRPLRNGDEVYPAMLDAIARAERSVALSTYIFAHDASGLAFAEALGAAVQRGVQVRVLIDDVGARYSFPTISSTLHRRRVRTAFFMPTFFHWRMPYINLRSHRKILLVDGRLGFTGGINIRHNNLLAEARRDQVQDLHFEVRGPVLAQLHETFAEDWAFSTGEMLSGEAWALHPASAGATPSRVINDGPDEDFDKLRRVILGALACARERIRIATPYFLPDLSVVSALNVAALRGVQVEILIPEKNNLRTVGWACRAQLWQVLERGCRVWFTKPPFDHTKAMIVDDAWCMVGSGNWDARSLRLNFETNLESYDPALAAALNRILDEKQATARPVTLADMDGRSLPARLRDGVARLFSPYL
jgi:cardiolipin synthase